MSEHDTVRIPAAGPAAIPGAAVISAAPAEPTPDDLYHWGRLALRRRLWDTALANLGAAYARGITHADAHYHLALATLRGQRPSHLSRAQVRQAEHHLAEATKNAHLTHAFALWRALKHDYYILAGRPDDGPPIPPHDEQAPVDPLRLTDFLHLALRSGTPPPHQALRPTGSTAHARAETQKYFAGDPRRGELVPVTVKWAAAGFCLLVAWLSGSVGLPWLLVLVLLALAGGLGWWGYRQRAEIQRRYSERLREVRPRPDGGALDDWIALDMARISLAALDALGLTPADVEYGPLATFTAADHSVAVACENDGRYRFSAYSVLVATVTSGRRLGIYQCRYEIRTGRTSAAESYDCALSHLTGIRSVRGRAIDPGGVAVASEDGIRRTLGYGECVTLDLSGGRGYSFPTEITIAGGTRSEAVHGARHLADTLRWILHRETTTR
ncbi:MAG: hypothetical protein JWO79_4720 [Actinomycetia bacterium]|nr:hypothetical protein [Actinomycetes bacterium]